MTILEFDSTYSAITGEHVGGHYIPTVESGQIADVLIDGVGLIDGPGPATEWRALTGYTRQQGYQGAVMHSSETMNDNAIREAVRDAGGDVFAIVAVESCQHADEPDSTCAYAGCDCELAGWAVIYRKAA